MSQQARNLLIQLDDEGVRPLFLVRDRDSTFTRAFDGVFPSEGITVIKAPVRAPKARAHAERWVGTVRRECLDQLLILGRRHLQHVLAAYGAHYNEHRPHQALEQQPPLDLPPPIGEDRATYVIHFHRVRRRDLLGGLIHEYRRAASSDLTRCPRAVRLAPEWSSAHRQAAQPARNTPQPESPAPTRSQCRHATREITALPCHHRVRTRTARSGAYVLHAPHG